MPGRRDATPRLAIAAKPFLSRPDDDGARRDLLTAEERERLAPIAALIRVERGATLLRQGAEATAIYDIADGVLKSTVLRPDGTGRWNFDLWRANTLQLMAAGVPEEQVHVTGLDTGPGTPFFSHRAQNPCGRFAAVARLRERQSR